MTHRFPFTIHGWFVASGLVALWVASLGWPHVGLGSPPIQTIEWRSEGRGHQPAQEGVAGAVDSASRDSSQQRVADLRFSDDDSTRWLMLQNGAVFHGRLQKQGERWIVQLDQKTRMQFDQLQVAAIADQLEDLYHYRRSRLASPDPSVQAQLVRWCIKNSLLAEAQEEFRQLRVLTRDPSLLSGLELQLRQAEAAANPSVSRAGSLASSAGPTPVPMLNAPVPAGAERAAPRAAAIVPLPPVATRHGDDVRVGDTRTGPDFRPGRSASSQRPSHSLGSPVLARAVEPEVPAQEGSPGNPGSATPLVNSVFSFYDREGFDNDTRVQQAIDDRLPQESVDQFVESVHWIVVQACAGCHFPESPGMAGRSEFLLEIPAAAHKATPAELRHNLRQVMTLIQRDNPGNSRLLAISREAYGGLEAPAIAADSQEFRSLTAWIFNMATQGDPPLDQSRVTVASAVEEPLQTEHQIGSTSIAGSLGTALGETGSGRPNRTEGNDGPAATSFPMFGSGPTIDPHRPYDPEVFNQYFHGRTAPGSADRSGQNLDQEVLEQGMRDANQQTGGAPLYPAIPRLRRGPSPPLDGPGLPR